VKTPTSADENLQPFERIERIEPFEHVNPPKPQKHLQPQKPPFSSQNFFSFLNMKRISPFYNRF
jgi:hypothetical protein